MSTRFTICTAHPFSLPRTFSPYKLCSLFPVLFYLFSHIVQHRHFVYISESPPFSKSPFFYPLSTYTADALASHGINVNWWTLSTFIPLLYHFPWICIQICTHKLIHNILDLYTCIRVRVNREIDSRNKSYVIHGGQMSTFISSPSSFLPHIWIKITVHQE